VGLVEEDIFVELKKGKIYVKHGYQATCIMILKALICFLIKYVYVIHMLFLGSGYFSDAGKISRKMVNGYFAGTDYYRITIIITIIKTTQKSFEKFNMIIIIVK